MSFTPSNTVSGERHRDTLNTVLRNWQIAAGCQGMDTELYFNTPNRNKEVLAPLCEGCPVVGNCLSTMMPTNTDRNALLYGYWGGINVEPVTGKILNYIRAIASGVATGEAGNEISYIATRFLMERIGPEERADGGAIDDELFEELIALLKSASQRRLAGIVELSLASPESAAELHGHTLVNAIGRIAGGRIARRTAF